MIDAIALMLLLLPSSMKLGGPRPTGDSRPRTRAVPTEKNRENFEFDSYTKIRPNSELNHTQLFPEPTLGAKLPAPPSRPRAQLAAGSRPGLVRPGPELRSEGLELPRREASRYDFQKKLSMFSHMCGKLLFRQFLFDAFVFQYIKISEI